VIAILTCWAAGIPSIPLGVIGLVLAVKNKAGYNTKPGFILSLIGLALGCLVFVAMLSSFL